MLKTSFSGKINEAGCDEAGRGCLAGPVFAAAVMLPADFFHPELNDSKQLSPKIRLKLRDEIIKHALAWAVAQSDAACIDKVNILNASILTMHKALDALNISPGYIIVDGNRFKPYDSVQHKCIVKGDALYMSIAAASVLAKTFRDEYMQKIHLEYPCYQWNRNKGYPTKMHRLMIEKFGISPYHRRSFKLTDKQLRIQFANL